MPPPVVIPGPVACPSVDGLVLRPAACGDVPTVLEFIRALAEYERLSHQVEATEADIADALFGEHKVAEVVLAEQGGDAAGFALYYFGFSTFVGRPGLYLEDLFVRPQLRGRGIGTALLAYLARIALERRCGRMEWSVLDWNEPSIRFYRGLGAVAMDEWTTNRIAGERLDALAGAVEFHPAT